LYVDPSVKHFCAMLHFVLCFKGSWQLVMWLAKRQWIILVPITFLHDGKCVECNCLKHQHYNSGNWKQKIGGFILIMLIQLNDLKRTPLCSLSALLKLCAFWGDAIVLSTLALKALVLATM
jgi:hypothetical protein